MRIDVREDYTRELDEIYDGLEVVLDGVLVWSSAWDLPGLKRRISAYAESAKDDLREHPATPQRVAFLQGLEYAYRYILNQLEGVP